MAISPIQNDNQNTITAISGGVIAGTTGALVGYNFAPRHARSLDEVFDLKPDIFYKTIDNMARHSEESLAKATLQLVPSKYILERTKSNIDHICPEDKVEVKVLHDFIANEKKVISKDSKALGKLIKSLLACKDKDLTVNDYINELKGDKAFSKINREAFVELITSMVGEENLDEKLPVQNLIEVLEDNKKNVQTFAKTEIHIYEEMLKQEKEGVIAKSDMLDSAKKSLKPIFNDILDGLSFDSVKKFVPRKDKAKWAVIVGGISAIVTALGVKLFGKLES